MARRRRPTRACTAIVAIAVLGLTVSVAVAQESVIFGTDADETLGGTPGPDSIYGRGGNDVLFGLEGDDELDGGPGADLISGGPGRDAVSYAGSAPVSVTLDGQADDGVPGEGDNVGPDVEDVFGSSGPDKLVGNGAENTLDGGAGDDQLTGGPGSDGLFGDEGDDRIVARDGSIDRVECGPGANDVAIVDAGDIARDCEEVGREAVTENFQLARIFPAGGARAHTLRLANIVSGSRITVACISRCRPRSPRTRVIARRRSVASSGGARAVHVRIKRSPLVAGATFEIGVKAPRARARCRRFRLVKRNGRIDRLVSPSTRCRSVARNG